MSGLKSTIFKTIVKAQKHSVFFKKLIAFTAYRSQQAMIAASNNPDKQSKKQNELKKIESLRESLKHPLKGALQDNSNLMRSYLDSYHFKDEAVAEMAGYIDHAFYRFLYTLDLIPPATNKASLLEIGANPYFMTLLLDKYTNYDLKLTNFYGQEGQVSIDIKYGPNGDKKEFSYSQVNLETHELPYPEQSFDVVLYCEVIEHLPQDSLITLTRIKKVLKPDGYLILTTPNVNRLENIVRMIGGNNIYDPYSGYGIYGRHNREFTTQELRMLLTFAGFDIEEIFTSDVTPNNHIFESYPIEKLLPLLNGQEDNLGEYIFIRARNTDRSSPQRKPKWLYRSYQESELTD